MTREEALKLLKTDGLARNEAEADRFCEAFDMAIRALENHDTFMKYAYSQGKQDALSQEPCTDAVSREAVYSILKEYHIDEEEIDSVMDECQNLTVNAITSDVSLLPSVTQKSGKWIPVSEGLPKEGESVIASTKYSVYPEARYTKKYGWEWACDADYWSEFKVVVTAWMPLPKTYKESET